MLTFLWDDDKINKLAHGALLSAALNLENDTEKMRRTNRLLALILMMVMLLGAMTFSVGATQMTDSDAMDYLGSTGVYGLFGVINCFGAVLFMLFGLHKKEK